MAGVQCSQVMHQRVVAAGWSLLQLKLFSDSCVSQVWGAAPLGCPYLWVRQLEARCIDARLDCASVKSLELCAPSKANNDDARHEVVNALLADRLFAEGLQEQSSSFASPFGQSRVAE